MMCNVYSIHDSKAGCFSRPWYALNDAVAIRSIQQLVNDPSTEICRHAADFSLFRLGTFDDNDGTFHNENPIINMGLASTFKEVANAPE